MRSPLSFPRALVVAALAASAVLVAAPTTSLSAHAAEPVSAAATPAADTCTVSGADLTWGFKESFRSYISGSIAHGEWQVIDGAAYATPAFTWSTATGTTSPGGAPAEVAFTGGIHFTGHDGLLDTTVANPTLVIDSAAHAVLRLDVASVPMDAAMAGDTAMRTLTQVPFVDIDLTGATITATDGGVDIAVTDAPTAITADGFAAFGNYAAGTAFDPISIHVVAACAVQTAVATPVAGPEPTVAAALTSDETDAADIRDTSWGVLVGAAAALAVVAAVVIPIVVTRRRQRAQP